MHKYFKIALIDQRGNAGGGIRFSRQLLLNFSKYNKDIKLDYYGNPESIKKERFDKLKLKNTKIIKLQSLLLKEEGILSIKNSNKIIKQLQNKFKKPLNYLPPLYSGNLKKELEIKLKNYNSAIFVWPYLIDVPNVNINKIIILHDFLFKYYFGAAGSYNVSETKKLNNLVEKWIKNSNVVITSKFMRNEIKKFYPNINLKKLHLIRMGPFTNFKKKKKNKNILRKFGIKSKYILCPTVDKPHKNIYNLIRAFFLVKKKFKNIKLVFCGAGTKIINGINLSTNILLNDTKNDVIGLGYVTNEEVDCLISKAELTINQSLYEPGNGSGLDSWFIGTPVAMSNIASFKEHIDYLGVKAEVFDPHNPLSIYKKISKILNMKTKEKKRIINISKQSVKKVNWRNLTNKYYNLLKNLK